MILREKTVDELFDLAEEFEKSINEDTDAHLHEIISIYQSLYRKIRSDKENEYHSSLPYIRGKLISYLVRYGTYLKTQDRKDDRTVSRDGHLYR